FATLLMFFLPETKNIQKTPRLQNQNPTPSSFFFNDLCAQKKVSHETILQRTPGHRLARSLRSRLGLFETQGDRARQSSLHRLAESANFVAEHELGLHSGGFCSN